MMSAQAGFQLTGSIEGKLCVFFLLPGQSSIGSAEDNTICLPHRTVSRYHARVLVDGEGITVEDLDSKNGTYLNGARVEKGRVREGDSLGFGPIELKLASVAEEVRHLGIRRDDAEPELGGAEMPGVGWTATESGTPGGGRLFRFLAWFASELAACGSSARPAGLQRLKDLTGSDAVAFLGWNGEGEPAIQTLLGVPALPAELLETREWFAAVSRASEGDMGQTFTRQETSSGRRITGAIAPGNRESAMGLLVRTAAGSAAGELRPFLLAVLQLVLLPGAGPVRRSMRVQAVPSLTLPPDFAIPSSCGMTDVLDQVLVVAPGRIPVLITGETGTGKDVLARILHASSGSRSAGPFQAINCAALPADLLEAELFGVEKGSATGVLERTGLIQMADGGTLFLDEVGDMPLPLQPKLLRALQTFEVMPVGGRRALRVDVRILSATNSDPDALIQAGKLRRDLYYRLAGWTLEVPPLRDRPEDIPALVEHFLNRQCADIKKRVRGVTARALERLSRSRWPGNVRQLEHEVHRMVYACPEGGVIDTALLEKLLGAAEEAPNPPPGLDLGRNVSELESRLIRQALEKTRGNRSRAAELLGISRPTLYAKITEYGIE